MKTFLFAPDENSGAGGTEPEKVVTLSQEKLNEIIDEAYARAFKKARGELEEKELLPLRQRLEMTQLEVKRLQEELLRAGRAPEKNAGAQDKQDKHEETISRAELEELLAKKDEEFKSVLAQKEQELQQRQQTIQALLAERKRQALEVAAAQAGAINPAIVAKLLADYIAEDEEMTLYVKSEKGEGKRLSDKGNPMTVEEFVTEWLNKNPYLLRPEVRAGGGAVPSNARVTTKTIDDQIREAEQKGDIRTAIRLKQQKLHMLSRV